MRALNKVSPGTLIYSLALLTHAELGRDVPTGIITLDDLENRMLPWIQAELGPARYDVGMLVARIRSANRSSFSNRWAHYDWLYRTRRSHGHPGIRRLQAALAGLIFSSVPVLFPVSAALSSCR